MRNLFRAKKIFEVVVSETFARINKNGFTKHI